MKENDSNMEDDKKDLCDMLGLVQILNQNASQFQNVQSVLLSTIGNNCMVYEEAQLNVTVIKKKKCIKLKNNPPSPVVDQYIYEILHNCTNQSLQH